MKRLIIDMEYVHNVLLELLNIPSPTGYTDEIVHFVGGELTRLGISFQLTRRGAIQAILPGKREETIRAVVTHLDTLGAMVKKLKKNGRLEIVPIGTWSSRFAEGARVTIFTDKVPRKGTILPLKASGHTYDREIDELPVKWDYVEVRVDEACGNKNDLEQLGFAVGDYIAIDANPQVSANGFINARHLDDKAGVALVLGAAKAVWEQGLELDVTCKLLFTIEEEVGVGASAGLQENVAEMVTVDNATLAPGQNSSEYGVTVALMDSSGPFDFHLTHHLIRLCKEHDILYEREVFKYYRSDSASALAAGNDLRTALLGFGVDGSHGYERSNFRSLQAVAELVALYMQTELTFTRDRLELGPLNGFPHLPGSLSPEN